MQLEKTLRTFSTDKDAKQDKIKKKTGTNRLIGILALTDFQPVGGSFLGNWGVPNSSDYPGKYSVKNEVWRSDDHQGSGSKSRSRDGLPLRADYKHSRLP